MHRELRLYNDALVTGMAANAAEAASRQRPARAADLGLLPLDRLDDTASLPHRIAFLNELHEQVGRGRGCAGKQAGASCRCKGSRTTQQSAHPVAGCTHRGFPVTAPCLPCLQVQGGEALRACIAATVAADVAGVRRDLLPWLQYHTELGVGHFYVRLDLPATASREAADGLAPAGSGSRHFVARCRLAAESRPALSAHASPAP